MNADAIDPLLFTERFSSAFMMRSPVFTATALFAFVSLVLGRPQDRRLHTRDVADDFIFNPGPNPNGFTIPSSSDFQPSSPEGASYSSTGFPNLGFSAPETLSALPHPPAINDAFGSTGLPTDYTNTLNLPGDGASDMAMVVIPPPEKFVAMQTNAVQRSIDLVSNGQFTYAIFELARVPESLVPTILSNDNDWNAFAQKVRTAEPSYVLHSIPDGMLLIFTYQADLGLEKKATSLLYDNCEKFQRVVQSRCEKRVYGTLVNDDASLRDAIDSHSKAPPIILAPYSPLLDRYHLDD
ncbi:hypothetical protein MMC29_006069 [Sticta canariensis]|nr:hypothetical protein [Sticta canariensis]